MLKLSILVCNILKRDVKCMYSLKKQQDPQVEILILSDDQKRSIGCKRNNLLSIAKGEYVTFVDDDDRIAPDYVKVLLKAIEGKPDVVNFIVEVDYDRIDVKPCYYSKRNINFNTTSKYLRLPNHLMCIKRELALQVGFEDCSSGEDFKFANGLKPLIQTELNLNKILYYYDFNSNTTTMRCSNNI